MGDLEIRHNSSTLFKLLSGDAWTTLSGQMEQRSFPVGAILIRQGTSDPDFHVVTEGEASIVAVSPRGESRELGRVGYGECIGEMSLLTGEPASADVVALTPMKTFAVSQARLANLDGVRSDLLSALSALLATRLRHANDRLLTMRAASIHVFCCSPADAAALAGLPEALASAGSPVGLVLAATDPHRAAAASWGLATGSVTLRGIDLAETGSLPAILERAGREHGDVLLLCDEECARIVGRSGVSLLHLMREDEGASGRAAHASPGQIVVIGSSPWTPPSLRRLTAELGGAVVAVLPATSPDAGLGAPISRLARTLVSRRVGVAFGAGSAKGLAHIGVLRALREMDVPIDVVSGCSIGAAIAAGVAAGRSIDELSALVIRAARRAFRPTLPLHSFLSNAGIRDELKVLAGDIRMEDLDLPIAIVATDLLRRSEVTFTSGPLWPRMLASMAIPGVFPPSRAMGSYLVDGGVLNPVPVQQCRDLGADIVIGIRLTAKGTSPRGELERKPGRPFAVETIMQTFEIMLNRISEMSSELADVNIEVCIEGGGGLGDFKREREMADAGYRAAMAAAPAIRSVIPSPRAAT